MSKGYKYRGQFGGEVVTLEAAVGNRMLQPGDKVVVGVDFGSSPPFDAYTVTIVESPTRIRIWRATWWTMLYGYFMNEWFYFNLTVRQAMNELQDAIRELRQ